MKKLITSMLVGGIIGHIITKQRDVIKSMKRDYKQSGDAYLRGVSEGLEEGIKRGKSTSQNGHVGVRRSGRYPWTDVETHSIEDIILDNEDEAMQVLTSLHNLQREYGQASVADLYDLVGIISNFTDNQWGWKDLSTMTYGRVCLTGYRLNLPSPVKL